MHRFVSLFAIGALAATVSAQTIVIPNGMAAAEGASSTAYPWGRGNAQIRVQYVYDSTHFTAQGVNYPIVISSLRYRCNGAATTAGYTYGAATVMMSNAAVDYLVPSTTFASNHGANVATVYTGPVTVASGAGTTPNNWYVTIPITPFVYDPLLSDLCLDMATDAVGAPSATGPAHDCMTTGALTSRINNLTNYTSPTGTTQQNVGIVVELTFTPASGMIAGFTANVTSGPSPLAVNFTDQSFSSDPGGIAGWAWDFDGDNVIDSNLQNPSFVYTNCGTYNVTLTVTDATHPPATLTKTAYIKTDEIVANFTSTVVSPLTVQFTDTSSVPATSWSWDLNGDSIIDSTVQNPLWVYPSSNRQNVTLTVTRLCSAPSSVTKQVAVLPTLVTPNGFANAVGNVTNNFPWNQATTSTHIQFLVDSTHFTNQGVTSPIVISNLRYRPGPGATTTWAGGTWPNVQIGMATSPVDWSVASTTFANNLGPDLTTVLNGPVTVAPGTTLGVGVVVPWYIDIPLTTSFVYDPTSGNDLTIDISLSGVGWTGTSRAADHVSTTGVALGSRVYNTTSLAAPTGTFGTSYGVVTEFSYVPANGLYAAFSANVTSGALPLAVNFSDTTFTSDPGGVTSWAWDFDGDSLVDSTLQHPSFLYTTCGTYNVSLTVTDATHPANTVTKVGYIQAGLTPIAADFTAQVIGPLTVQFADTSNLPATSWAWDLDGDNITDSTVQNPTWVYANSSAVNVRLTVTAACSGPSTVTKPIVPMQQISHNVAPANGLSTGALVYFDLNVTNPHGVEITSMDVFASAAATPFTVDIYMKQGPYLSFEKVPSVWTKVVTGSGTSTTTTTPSPVALAAPLYLPMGNYGIAMQYIGVGPRYSGTAASGPLQTVTNGDLSLTTGASLQCTITSPFVTASTPITPRFWSGTLYYETFNVAGGAALGTFGQGCAGSMGIAHLSGNQPQLGSTLNVTVNNLPQSLAIMMVGFSNTASAFGPLPFSVAPFGAPGCFGRVSPDATQFLIGAANSAVWTFTVPNDPSMSGLHLFTQAMVLDPGFNTLGAVLSDAGAMVVGS